MTRLLHAGQGGSMRFVMLLAGLVAACGPVPSENDLAIRRQLTDLKTGEFEKAVNECQRLRRQGFEQKFRYCDALAAGDEATECAAMRQRYQDNLCWEVAQVLCTRDQLLAQLDQPEESWHGEFLSRAWKSRIYTHAELEEIEPRCYDQ